MNKMRLYGLLLISMLCVPVSFAMKEEKAGEELSLRSSDGKLFTIPAQMAILSQTLRDLAQKVSVDDKTESKELVAPLVFSEDIIESIIDLMKEMMKGEALSPVFSAWLERLKNVSYEKQGAVLSALIYFDIDLGSQEDKDSFYHQMILFIFECASNKKKEKAPSAFWKNLTKAEVLTIIHSLKDNKIPLVLLQDLKWIFLSEHVLNGKLVALSSNNNSVVIQEGKLFKAWDLVDGREIATVPLSKPYIKSVKISDDGAVLVVEPRDNLGMVEIWYKGTLLGAHTAGGDSLSISRDGAFIVAGEALWSIVRDDTSPTKVRLCGMGTISASRRYLIEKDDNTYLVLSSSDRHISVCSLSQLRDRAFAKGCSFSPEHEVASEFASHHAHLFEESFLSPERNFMIARKKESPAFGLYDLIQLSQIVYDQSPDKALVGTVPFPVGAEGDGILLKWDAFAVSVDGRVVVIPTVNNQLFVWHPFLKRTFFIRLHADEREDKGGISFSLSPSGKYCIAFGKEFAHLYDTDSGKMIRRLKIATGFFDHIEWSSDESYVGIIYLHEDGFRIKATTMDIRSLRSGALLKSFIFSDGYGFYAGNGLERIYGKSVAKTIIYSPDREIEKALSRRDKKP